MEQESLISSREAILTEAESCVQQAHAYDRARLDDEELAFLRRAVLLYAAADAMREDSTEIGPLTRARADLCRLFADRLVSAQHHAEAATIYQEATDLYGLLEPDAKYLAGDCARRLLECISAVRDEPRERLQLLIARYERSQQQLALDPGTEAQQAECCIHIARIFQRREMPEESVVRYKEALELLSAATVSPEMLLARAECNHRIASLLVGPLNDPSSAVRHYRSAIELYRESEPFLYGFQQSLELCKAALARTASSVLRPDLDRAREASGE